MSCSDKPLRGCSLMLTAKPFRQTVFLSTLQTASVPALFVCLFSKQAGTVTQNYLSEPQEWMHETFISILYSAGYQEQVCKQQTTDHQHHPSVEQWDDQESGCITPVKPWAARAWWGVHFVCLLLLYIAFQPATHSSDSHRRWHFKFAL